MDGYLTDAAAPVIVEIDPNRSFLPNEVGPDGRVVDGLLEYLGTEASVVACCSHHIEERENAIEWVPHDDDTLVCVEFDAANSFGIVRLDDPHFAIEGALSRQTHLLQLHVERPTQVAVRPRVHPSEFLQVSPEQRVARSRITCQDDLLSDRSCSTILVIYLDERTARLAARRVFSCHICFILLTDWGEKIALKLLY